MPAPRGLGRGLESLIPANVKTEKQITSTIQAPIAKIRPNRYQPRMHFNEEALAGLAQSIRAQGLIQPLVVTPLSGDPEYSYELIAGERRLRASTLAELKEVPVIIKEVSDQERFQMALIENIQREDLNPIEEAIAYKKLMESFNLTQEEMAEIVGKNRTVIANTLRLLNLPQVLQDAVSSGAISAGHARNLVSIGDESLQRQLAEKILAESLTVRDVERIVSDHRRAREASARGETFKPEAEIVELERKLESILGTKVQLSVRGKGKYIKGSIKITYFSLEDLERVSELILKENLSSSTDPGAV